MNQAIRCKCGKLSGQLSHPEKATRIKCYCKDCQAFAHYLGRAGDMLDAQGGSDIVVSHPQEITFDKGAEAIACMSLSTAGMLRWYARCCNTPIGNTSRNNKMAFVGLSSTCLATQDAFGPWRMVSCTASAREPVAASGMKAVPVMLGFGALLLRARLSGSYARSPFFKPGSAEPVAVPTVLAKEESDRLRLLA